ncbi:MAG: hypothetical protein AAF928_07150 [Myxococcota bacterium]
MRIHAVALGSGGDDMAVFDAGEGVARVSLYAPPAPRGTGDYRFGREGKMPVLVLRVGAGG